MNLSPTRILVLVTLLAMAGLASLWVDHDGKLKNISWVAPAPVKPVLTPVPMLEKAASSPDIGAFAVIVERPLFAPDRRAPPTDLPLLQPPPTDLLTDARLLGLVSGDAGAVLIKSEQKVRRIAVNQTLGEWTLSAIDNRSATFKRGAESRVMRLEYARLGSPLPALEKAAVANPAGVPSASNQQTEAARRQIQEEAERVRSLEEMRARMVKKAP